MLAILALLFVSPKVDLHVTYSKATGQDLKMDIYHPETPATKAAVIVIHGGAWIGGDRKDMKPICELISKSGMLAASIQYRFAPKTRWPGFYDDVQTAVRYLRANAQKLGIDPNRIGATGASAGGHLALLLGVSDTRDKQTSEYPSFPSRVSAVLDIFGPTDMSRDYPQSYDMLFMTILGKARKDSAEEIKAASPVSYIDKRTAPVFIIHGLADPVVPVAQSKWLESKLRTNGTFVEAHYIDGMKHELPPTNEEVVKAVTAGVAWLKATLTK